MLTREFQCLSCNRWLDANIYLTSKVYMVVVHQTGLNPELNGAYSGGSMVHLNQMEAAPDCCGSGEVTQRDPGLSEGGVLDEQRQEERGWEARRRSSEKA